MTSRARTNIPGLAGERDDLFEIAEDSADMLQPFASTCDHYGTLPCIDEEICLHARQPRGVSKIPKCLVKKAGDSLEGLERLLLHYRRSAVGVARCMAQRAANRIGLFSVERLMPSRKQKPTPKEQIRSFCILSGQRPVAR